MNVYWGIYAFSFVATGAITAILIRLWARPSMVEAKRLQRDDPEALVVIVRAIADFDAGLRRLGLEPRHMPWGRRSLIVLRVKSGALELWRPGSQLLATFDRSNAPVAELARPFPRGGSQASDRVFGIRLWVTENDVRVPFDLYVTKPTTPVLGETDEARIAQMVRSVEAAFV